MFLCQALDICISTLKLAFFNEGLCLDRPDQIVKMPFTCHSDTLKQVSYYNCSLCNSVYKYRN